MDYTMCARCDNSPWFLSGISEEHMTVPIPACGKQHPCYLLSDSGVYDSYAQMGLLVTRSFSKQGQAKFNQEVIKVLNQRIKKKQQQPPKNQLSKERGSFAH